MLHTPAETPQRALPEDGHTTRTHTHTHKHTHTHTQVATVMDAFTSSPTAGTSRYTVRGCTGDPGAMLCANCPRIVRADVIDNGDSTYSASFTATRKGQYSVCACVSVRVCV